MRAEVISIGDEMTSGQRLDTNTQWISQSLGELGIPVAFHTTVGDCLEDHTLVLRTAIDRADLIIMTGGLGPTADDLTRDAISEVSGRKLELNPDVLEHILARYRSYGRPMPESNRSQAMFPRGSQTIPNREGTAPGIDLSVDRIGKASCRVIALPGVPVEMKQMWEETVVARLKELTDDKFVIHHHSLHCFGMGESSVEAMLPDLVRRGRDPSVGITASSATISLRISTRGRDRQECKERIEETIQLIRDCLGDLVFGENGQTLESVVGQQLVQQGLRLGIIDGGLGGEVTRLLQNDSRTAAFVNGCEIDGFKVEPMVAVAARARAQFQSDLGLAIGSIDDDEEAISIGKSTFEVALVGPRISKIESFRFSGHSGWRRQRAAKQVLNFCRLEIGKWLADV